MSDRRSGSEASHDRRRHYRADFDACAVIHAAQIALRGKIIDVSLGGVRIRRIDDAAPCPAPGTSATVEFEIGGRGWVAQNGRIQRCEFDEIVIAFGPLAAELEDLIEDEVLATVEASQRPRMIVVDPSAVRRRRVADALRVAGCDSYEAATPLEAIDLMERPHSHIRGVAVGETLTQTGADELCDFFAESNPHIRLALIADGSGDSIMPPDRGSTSDRVSVMASDETLEVSLRGFADAVAARPSRER